MKEDNIIFRILKIDIYFESDIFSKEIDPLDILYKISDIGDIVESNTNISQLPLLNELNENNFYISWTVVLRTRTSIKDLNDMFSSYKEISKINIVEYDEDYLSYVSDALMGNKIGEVLIEKGLISEKEIMFALKEQKKLGEILIEAGLITREQIEAALQTQKKLGEILIESGKIMPSKIMAIIEQQKQVREYKEMSTVKVDICKLNTLMSLVNKLSALEKEIDSNFNSDDAINKEEVKDKLSHANQLIAEIKKFIDKCRNGT